MLSPEQRRQWQDQGCTVLPGFKRPDEVAAACARARALVEAFQPDARTGTFSTRDRSRVADVALLASATAVHCFFEEDAFDAQGRLTVPAAQAVNKVGHALHEVDPLFTAFSRGPALAALSAELGLARPQVWQSQLIFKQPRIGGEVGWHQDASFFVTTPQTVTTFWFALEDATVDNGCLWVLPGGQASPLREQYVCLDRDPADPLSGRLLMQPLDATPWPSMQEAVPLEVPAGTLVCFGGLMPHCSAPNRSGRSRLAYTLHATDAGAVYSPLNWLQRDRPAPGFL